MIHSYSELSRENDGEGDVFFPGESDGHSYYRVLLIANVLNLCFE